MKTAPETIEALKKIEHDIRLTAALHDFDPAQADTIADAVRHIENALQHLEKEADEFRAIADHA